MDSFLSAIVPRAEVTFSDILDEQEREAKKEAQALRSENQRLQQEATVLRTQLALLSQERISPPPPLAERTYGGSSARAGGPGIATDSTPSGLAPAPSGTTTADAAASTAPAAAALPSAHSNAAHAACEACLCAEIEATELAADRVALRLALQLDEARARSAELDGDMRLRERRMQQAPPLF